jgi:hypothetical protein
MSLAPIFYSDAANQAAAVNAPIAFLLTVAHWRRVTAQRSC